MLQKYQKSKDVANNHGSYGHGEENDEDGQDHFWPTVRHARVKVDFGQTTKALQDNQQVLLLISCSFTTVIVVGKVLFKGVKPRVLVESLNAGEKEVDAPDEVRRHEQNKQNFERLESLEILIRNNLGINDIFVEVIEEFVEILPKSRSHTCNPDPNVLPTILVIVIVWQ